MEVPLICVPKNEEIVNENEFLMQPRSVSLLQNVIYLKEELPFALEDYRILPKNEIEIEFENSEDLKLSLSEAGVNETKNLKPIKCERLDIEKEDCVKIRIQTEDNVDNIKNNEITAFESSSKGIIKCTICRNILDRKTPLKPQNLDENLICNVCYSKNDILEPANRKLKQPLTKLGKKLISEKPVICQLNKNNQNAQKRANCLKEASFKSEDRKSKKQKQELSYVCNICNKVFKKRSVFRYHTIEHIGTHAHKCEKCGKGFRTHDELEYHLLSHDSKIKTRFSCPICQSQFVHKQYMLDHCLTHNKPLTKQCLICGLGFANRLSFSQHEKGHSLEKDTFDCPICKRQFYKRDYLISHCQKSVNNFGECSEK